MSSGITVQFKDAEAKEEFVILFDGLKRSPYGESGYISFKIEMSNNGIGDCAIAYLNFDDSYRCKNSISFEYSYGGCHAFFCYFLAYALSEKYKVKKLLWDTEPVRRGKREFFKRKDAFHCGFVDTAIFNREEGIVNPNTEASKDFKDRSDEYRRLEDEIKNKVCPNIFNDDKFKQYLWE